MRKKTLACLIILGVIVLFLFWRGGFFTRFEHGEWIAIGAKNDFGHYSRTHMANDLVRTKRLIGLTRGEVISLLGNPSKAGASEYEYIVDACWMDDEWLGVQFNDARNTVDQAKVYCD